MRTKRKTPELWGEKLNRNQIAEKFCVNLATVSAWINRGCPVLERMGREVFFDSARVFLWRGARDAAGQELADKTLREITEDIERTHARAWLWFHADSVRSKNAHIGKAITLIGEAMESFQDAANGKPARN